MSNMPAISGCLIVKDEESFLEECLTRLWKAVDEIVVVDTGSSDSTVAIAHRMGAQVYHHVWKDDFSEARNVALSHAAHPWILVVDADEYLDEGTLAHLTELCAASHAGYMIEVVNFPEDDDSRTISHHVGIFRNDPRFRYEGAIHESILPSIRRSGGSIGYLPIRLEHYGYQARVRASKHKSERNQVIIKRRMKARREDPALNYYMAQEYVACGALEDAVKYYRRALWMVGSRSARFVPHAAARLVLALGRLSRWDEAYEVLERYQPRYLGYTDLHFLEGVLSKTLGNYVRAEHALLKAISLGDADPREYEIVHVGYGSYRAWTELGKLYWELGRVREAVAAFTSGLKCNARYIPALQGLIRLALEHDPPRQVLDFVSRVADLSVPSCASAAWDVFFRARAWRECETLAQVLADDERDARNALSAVGKGAAKEARSRLLELASHGRATEGSLTAGVLLAVEKGDKDLARRLLDEVEEEGLNATLRDLVSLFSGAGAGFSARQYVGVSVGEKTGHAWRLVGNAMALGLTVALDYVGRLIAAYGVSSGARALRFGHVLAEHGLTEAAVEQYLRAGLQGEYDAPSLLILARHAIQTGHSAEAIPLLQHVVKEASPGALPYVVLARILRDQGRCERARDLIREGLLRYPYASLLKQELEALSVDDRSPAPRRQEHRSASRD